MSINEEGSIGTTHFGFEEVAARDKAGRVGDVFHSVAARYDVMNDLMSLGAHRLWKRFAVAQSGVRSGDWVLDVAGGTGDLAWLLAARAGVGGRVVLSDINDSMLLEGRRRILDRGGVGNFTYLQADAENLAFADDSFHCVTIGFGLRNVTDIGRALASMYRVLRPGGRVVILEFSKPVLRSLSKLYDAYSFTLIPRIGRLVANDEASYRYLVESIRRHPDQRTLEAKMQAVGFERTRYFNLSGGIVAVHVGFKL
jgi:demethylmenaquinone methyltransferase/2-methoxy-6-polyprenyl-1,4-benzoquinol methylase